MHYSTVYTIRPRERCCCGETSVSRSGAGPPRSIQFLGRVSPPCPMREAAVADGRRRIVLYVFCILAAVFSILPVIPYCKARVLVQHVAIVSHQVVIGRCHWLCEAGCCFAPDWLSFYSLLARHSSTYCLSYPRSVVLLLSYKAIRPRLAAMAL